MRTAAEWRAHAPDGRGASGASPPLLHAFVLTLPPASARAAPARPLAVAQVFYSVLVSRAALYDASTMAACFVAVIMGLGGTLFLLSVYRKALPALPISIFLGVSVYFATRFAITPMLSELVVGSADADGSGA